MDITNIRRITFEMLIESGATTPEQINLAMSKGADELDAVITECLSNLNDNQIELLLARVRKKYYEKFVS